MGEISIQQAALTGSIKSSENLTCEIVPEGGVSGKMVSPDIVHEVGVETPATRDKLGLVRVGENLKITTDLLGFPPSTTTYGNPECMVGKRPSNSTCT